VANIRKDFLHKESFRLANENQVVCVEDLNVKGMLRNHCLAKAISDVSWSEFFRQLEYKTAEHGGVVVKVPTFYPSSQTCSCCGYQNPIVKNLAVRQWDCPKCKTHHDRDGNAAANILNKGLEMLAS
jgi:putative transposase